MAANLAPVPEGYHTVTPWIVTKDTAGLLDFIKAAFDAEELGRVHVDGGAIGHAEARIGDSIVMMFDSPFPVETPGCCGSTWPTRTRSSSARCRPGPALSLSRPSCSGAKRWAAYATRWATSGGSRNASPT